MCPSNHWFIMPRENKILYEILFFSVSVITKRKENFLLPFYVFKNCFQGGCLELFHLIFIMHQMLIVLSHTANIEEMRRSHKKEIRKMTRTLKN